MEHHFAPREQVWAPRGRRPKPVPQEVLLRLQATAVNGEVWVTELGPEDGPEEIRELLSLLRAGARQLGGRLRVQPMTTSEALAAGQIRCEMWGVAS